MINDGLIENKNQVYIINTPDSKPFKIVWEDYPCPKDATYRCKYSKFTSEGLEICISCELVKCVRIKRKVVD